jgi:hypothetical protein
MRIDDFHIAWLARRSATARHNGMLHSGHLEQGLALYLAKDGFACLLKNLADGGLAALLDILVEVNERYIHLGSECAAQRGFAAPRHPYQKYYAHLAFFVSLMQK